MIAERWGSLGVADHTSTSDLIANVLLYDRLIVPTMTEQRDRDERKYWVNKGWKPDLQARRVEQLGRLAIPRPWTEQRRERFGSRMKELDAERFDTQTAALLAQATTRAILAMEPVTEQNPDVSRVDVIAAYNSESALQKEFPVAQSNEPKSAQGLLLARKLAIPNSKNIEESLERAIELSKDFEFRKKRTAMFDFQEDAIRKGWSAEETVKRLARMSDDLNEQIHDSAKTVKWKIAFLVCGIGISFVGGITTAVAASAALSTIQFLAFDRKPLVDADSTRPAAMFHDMKVKLGIRLDS